MKKTVLYIVLGILMVFGINGVIQAQEPLKGAIADLDKGWQNLNIPLLEKALLTFDAMAKKTPKDHLAPYYAAKAHYAIADCFDVKSSKEFDDTGEGDKHIDTALDMIQTSLTAKDNSADTHILKFLVIRRKMMRVGFPMLMMHVSTRKEAYSKAAS